MKLPMNAPLPLIQRQHGPATILYVENGVGFGGAVISLRNFLEPLDRRSYQSVLVPSLADPKFASFADIARTIHLPKNRLTRYAPLTTVRRVLNIDVLHYASRLARVAKAENAQLIYLNNDFIANMAGVIAGRWLKLPVVIHERDIPAPHSRLATWLTRWTERFLAISGPVREALLDMGVPLERITMVPEGLDLRAYQPQPAPHVAAVRASLGLTPDQPLIVMVGMIMEWKAQDVLLRAAPAILARHPRTHFLIIGETPPGREDYLRQLQRLADTPLLDNAVHFTGYRNDIPLYLQAADAVVHASVSPEPFGRVVIEAMAMGTPIVATAIGAPPEIIRHGETGLLTPPGDVEQLSQTLCTLLDNPEWRLRIGKAGRREVFQKYAIQRHAGLIQAVFDELLTHDLTLSHPDYYLG
ncbi:MAG TPA: hypothetical protein DEP36_00670 [Gammaproteobacteria bacterium]|nr:hypothetical protein [Gammaproteobacteria bacterium]